MQLNYYYYLRRLLGVRGLVFTSLVSLLLSTNLRSGLKLMYLTHYSYFFFYLFAFFKNSKFWDGAIIQNVNTIMARSVYTSFVIAYFTNANNTFVSVNNFLWWLTDFLDINFWFRCNRGSKSFRKKQRLKYIVEPSYYSKNVQKIKNTYRLLYLDGVFSGENTLLKRIFFSGFDTFFNYKNSLLYKRKIVVYKKLFQ